MGGLYGALCALCLTACAFKSGEAPSIGDANSDAAIAPPADAPGALCTSWMPHFFVACQIPAPFGDVHLTTAGSPYTYDTGSATLVDVSSATMSIANTSITQTGGDATLISVSSLTIDANVELDVVGSAPLIVASWGDISIAGTIDAGSHTATPVRTGAGANPIACAANVARAGTNDADAGGGSGGGGGGAFRGNGGLGGPGDNGSFVQNPGGAGGTGVAAPQVVRAGCNGAASGMAGTGATAPSNATTIASGGIGGGAIQLTSRTSLTFAATAFVLAGGGGGAGAEDESAVGGGGGGGGGYVGIEAPTITIAGSPTIAANGGGGGGSSPFAGTGAPGMDGPPSASAAAGGAASTCSVAGGTGGWGTAVDGVMAAQTSEACGGGGGGGGGGYVYVFDASFAKGSATISPMESVNPF